MGGGRREGDAVSDWYRQEGTYPPPPPPGGPTPPARSTTWWPLAVAAGLVVVALSSLAVVIAVRSGGDEPEAAPMPSPGAVRLEPVTYRNPAPFTKSVVAGDVRVLPGRVVGSTSADIPAPRGAVTGDTVHLYASTSTAPVCDKAALAERLRSERKVATAWASASGVEPAGVDGLLASLTPVVLRADTAVTNHVYRSGEPVAYQSVLQAGTPVMVDPTGLPRVQCSCGNPLLAPAEKRPTKTDGNGWKTFDEAQVVSVAPAAAPLPSITTVDLDTSKPATTATGSNTVLDGTLVAATDGLFVATPDGQLVKVLDQQVDAVFDDGRGGLVYTLADPNDLARNERPATVEQSTIWHLPAGSTEAVALIPPAQEGGWNKLLGAGTLKGRTFVVYGRMTRSSTANGSDPEGEGQLVARDLDSGSEKVLVDEAFGRFSWVHQVSFGGDRLGLMLVTENGDQWQIFGSDLSELSTACPDGEYSAPKGDPKCPGAGALDEQGRILTIPTDAIGTMPVRWVDPVTGANGSRQDYPTPEMDGGFPWIEQFHAGRAVIGVDKDEHQPSWFVFDLGTGKKVPIPSASGERWSWILTAPLVRPKAADPTTPTTSSAPRAKAAYRAPTVEELKSGFPSEVCGDDVGPVPIGSEGYGKSRPEPTSTDYVAIEFENQFVTTDVDGDGIVEAVVAPLCNWGGTAYSTPVAALRVGSKGIEILGGVSNEFGRTTRAIKRISTVDGGVVVSGEAWVDGDGPCCPSSTFTARLRFVDGRWQEE